MAQPPSAVTRHLQALGGVAGRPELTSRFTGREIRAAVEAGLVLRDAPGRYALPSADAARRAVRRVNGVAVGRGAAAMWRLRLKTQPPRPEIAVPRGRRVRREDRDDYRISWRELERAEVRSGEATSLLRTVLDCAVTLRVAAHADGRAENPFESVLRAISLDVPGLRLVPQVPVPCGGRVIHPDLCDAGLRIVVEGDSYEFHTMRRQIDIDCERYDELALDEWLVLRFSHPQAMGRQDWVRSVLARGVEFRKATTTAVRRAG